MKKETLQSLLEESIYQTYKKTQPSLVDGIRVLLIKGQTKKQIKSHVIKTIGKGKTENHIGYLIDFLYKKQFN